MQMFKVHRSNCVAVSCRLDAANSQTGYSSVKSWRLAGKIDGTDCTVAENC